jgi:DNA replication protein DnaC
MHTGEEMLEERRIEVTRDAHDRCDRLFPPRYRDACTEIPTVIEWVHAYHASADAPSLLLLGPTGTGKTYQAYAALRLAVCKPRPVRGVGYRADGWKAATHADLLASMRPGGRDHNPEQVLKDLRDLPLLLVDDLGVAKNSEWVEDITYRLMNSRYEHMKPSIFTSNLAIDQLKDALGDRITSRLAETCVRVALTGADRRRVKPVPA